MMFPDRFPFNVLDHAIQHCPGCGCDLSRPDGGPEAGCHYPADCDCHEEWRIDTPELLKREMWGDR